MSMRGRFRSTMWWCTAVCLCGVVIAAVAQGEGAESRLVITAQGPVRGYKDPEGGLYAFYSIPYATALTGMDRFKPPQPPPTWTEPFEAIDRGIICPQLEILGTENKTMQEDCLVANIRVPDTEETNLPVLVYVHGGAFFLGYGDSEIFASLVRTKKIIVVNFNYRLGILGFLCLGTEGVPGNAGLKDQVALLRWVKNNIANFGGNPDDVTIGGCSAASASVDLLMISKSTQGLFNKIISDSGANVGSFAVQMDPVENAKNHAKMLNFTNLDDINALEEFYKTAPVGLLTAHVLTDRKDSAITFAPCIERDTGDEVIIHDVPMNILEKGEYRRMPMLYGFTNMEGLMRIQEFTVWKNMMNDKFSDFLPGDLEFPSEEVKEEVAEMVKEFYFENQPVSNDTILSYIEYFTDVMFAYGMLRSVKVHNEAGNATIYLHKYSFFDENTFVVPNTNVRGANHCAQTMAVADEDERIITDEYRHMKNIMRELWSNFITSGNPVPEGSVLPAWPMVGADRSPHMSLGTTVQLQGPLLQRRALFWDAIYQRYYRMPVPPPAVDAAVSHLTMYFKSILIVSHFMIYLLV